MPNIERTKRPPLDEAMEPLLKKVRLGRTRGEITYILTRIVKGWLRTRGVSYDSLSDVKAVLNDTRDEFLRTVMNPYEGKKEEENGGVE